MKSYFGYINHTVIHNQYRSIFLILMVNHTFVVPYDSALALAISDQ